MEQALSELPLYIYSDIDPKSLEFAQRVRYICEHDCPMYGKSWACPPGVGSVESCKQKCERYANCLLIGDAIILLSGDNPDKYLFRLSKNKEGEIGDLPITFNKQIQRFQEYTWMD